MKPRHERRNLHVLLDLSMERDWDSDVTAAHQGNLASEG